MSAPRALAAAATLALLSACSARPDLTQEAEPIGDFRLGHNVVLATGATEGPLSRDASEEELADAVRATVEERLRRFDGDGLYHLGIRVEAFVLAQPGIPIVFSPRSVLLLALNVYDNETRERLNDEPIRVTAFEGANTGVPFMPSGLVKSREQQLENLAISAAQEIERLLRQQEETWFAPKPDRVRTEFTPQAVAIPETEPPAAEPGAADEAAALAGG
jgi:hypothetical protein